nr:RHS repeat-associated core domain-containing protein [uncultured Desulfobacter sp.]
MEHSVILLFNVSVARSDGKVIGKAYDDAGNLVQLTYPDGYYLDYSYDSLNRLEDIVEAGTTTLAAYTYDSLSRRSSTTFDNGVTTTVSYEPDNVISAMAFQFSGQAVTFDYTYDQAGNRVSFTATDDRFVYNPLANETKTYTVNNLNQYTEINTTSPAYDLNGNMISKGSAAFDYDSENRLIEAITTDTTSSYTSDPMGRRRSKTVNTATTSYLYDGDNVIMEYDQSGAMARRFVYGPMVDEPVCMITPSARYYYHADALGSVVALSDTSGSLAETYAYSPFGKTNGSSTLGNPYLFTGRRLDSESGLYYYRARHYDVQEGRFVQPDPIGFEGGINLYAYASNNPIMYLDPLGLVSEPGFWEGAIPIWGSGKSAVYHFEEGHYLRGAAYTALAVSDVFLLKAIATGIAKGAVKIAGSHTHNATSKWLLKKGLRESGEHAHHALIRNKGSIGKYIPDAIKNQPWNYKALDAVTHGRIHGAYKQLPRYNALGRWWFGSPQWSKAALSSFGGRALMGLFDDNYSDSQQSESNKNK